MFSLTRTRKKALFSAGLFLSAVLLIWGVFVFLTSSWMIVNVYLAIGSHFAGLELTAEEAEWDVFGKRLEFRNFRVGEADFPWVAGEHLSGKYHIGDVLEGEIRWSDIVLRNASARVLIDAGDAPEEPLRHLVKDGPAESDCRWVNRFDLRRVRVENCVFLYFEEKSGVRREKFELFGLNGTLSMLRPKTDSELYLRGRLRSDDFNGIHISGGGFEVTASGHLGNYLIPETLASDLRASDCRGRISVKELAGDTVHCRFKASRPGCREVRLEHFELRQYNGEELSSSMKCSGALRRSPLKLRSDFEIEKLSPELFSLLSELLCSFNPGQVELFGKGGFDYGDGVIAGRGKFELSRSGAAYFNGNKLELPAFHLESESDFSVDLEKRSAEVRKVSFVLSDGESGRRIVTVDLAEQVSYDWSDESAGKLRPAGDGGEKLSIRCEDLDLRLLRLLPFRPDAIELNSGWFSAGLSGKFSASGLHLEGGASLREIDLLFDGKEVRGLNMDMRVSGALTSDLELRLDRFSGGVGRETRRLGEYSGRLNCRFSGGGWNGRIDLLRVTPELIRYLVPLESVKFTEELLKKSGGGLGRVGVSFGRDGSSGESCLRDWNFVWENPAAGFTLNGTLADMTFDREFRPGGDWEATYSLVFPADFPERFGFPSGDFFEGVISGAGKLNFGRDFSRFSSSGKFRSEEGRLKVGGAAYDKVGWETEYACGSEDLKEWRFSRLDLYVHVNRASALRLEMPFVLRDNRLNGELSLRYLNAGLLNLFAPECFEDASISGTLQLDCGNIERDRWICGGSFAVDRLKFRHAPEPLYGTVAFTLKNDSTALELSALDGRFFRPGGGAAALFHGAMLFPAETEREFSGKLDVAELDGVFLRETAGNFSAAGREAEAAPTERKKETSGPETPEEKPFEFDFGPRRVRLDVAVRKLRWRDGDLSIRSVFTGAGRTAELKRFILDAGGSFFDCFWKFRSPEGGAVEFVTGGKSDGELPLELFLSFFLDWPGSRSRVKNATWDFSGTLGPDWGEKLKGGVRAEFGETVLSNDAAGGVLGRLMFLPMEVILRLGSVFPEHPTSVESWSRAMRSAGRLDSPVHKIHFDRGEFSGHAGDGRLFIDRFVLSGPAVRLLSFSGTIGIGRDEDLRLDSKISFTGLDLPLSIGGTLSDPSLKLINLLPETVGANVEKFLRVMWSIFQTE